MRGDFGNALRYPFLEDETVGDLDGGFQEGCGCRYACYPQFHALWEVVYGSRQKVGFAEFGAPSSPPRRFLRQRTTWQCYTAGNDPTTEFFWEQIGIDPATGDAVTTESDPAFVGCSGMVGDPVVEFETPTARRTVWQQLDGEGNVSGRFVQLEALENEFTTEQLINAMLDGLPAWAPDDVSWPGSHVPPDAAHGFAYFVGGGICYQRGRNIWDAGPDLVQVPSVWQLAEDEHWFFVQRVRYRIVAPFIIGSAVFSLRWRERFYPYATLPGYLGDPATALGDPEDPGAPLTFSGDETTPESDIREITERQENGQVFLCCAEFFSP